MKTFSGEAWADSATLKLVVICGNNCPFSAGVNFSGPVRKELQLADMQPL